MWQLQGTIILETNFIPICVLNSILLFSNIISIPLYIIAWKMRNLNNSIFWLQLSLLIKSWKKKKNVKMILKIWVQNAPRSIRAGSFLLCNPRVKWKYSKGSGVTWSATTVEELLATVGGQKHQDSHTPSSLFITKIVHELNWLSYC
jgi:hypothetical protein